MNLGARWLISDVKAGRLVVYENLERRLSFECGTERKDTPMDMLLLFILSEGDPGDLVFLNGKFYTQIQKEVTA